MYQLTIADQPVLVCGDPISPDGSLIAVLQKSTIYVLNILANHLIYQIPIPGFDEDSPSFILFGPDAKQLLVLTTDGHLQPEEDDSNTSYQLQIFDITKPHMGTKL